MPSEMLLKLNKLSAELKAKLSQEDFLAKVDRLEEKYGIKAVLILLDLLLGELDFSDLAETLAEEYGFNAFLAAQIKSEFGSLIEILGSDMAGEAIEIVEQALTPEKTKQPAAAAAPLEKDGNGIKRVAETMKMRESSIPAKRKDVADYFKKDAASQSAESAAAPIAEAKAVSDAGLIFSASDEAEINKFGAAANSKAVPNYTLDAEKILSAFKARPQDPDMMRRLVSVVVSRIRGLRDDLEIKEILTKEAMNGGVGLRPSDADELIKLIKAGGGNVDLSRVGFYPASQANIAVAAVPVSLKEEPPIDLDFGEPEESADDEASERESMPENATRQELRIEMENGLPVVKAPEASDKLSAEPKNVKIQPVETSGLPPASPLPFIAKKSIPMSVLNSKTAGRPNLDDIKLHRKLSGPIDDLANMTLIEFRRLAVSPKEAVYKIKNEIELLGQESFDKKNQGISAWQKSEVSNFYRLLGQVSMNEGISIEETIKDRLIAGKPTLTLDEFNAVMELNRLLRY